MPDPPSEPAYNVPRALPQHSPGTAVSADVRRKRS